VDNRLVTQAGSYGRYLTEIHLTIDRRTRDVVAASAHNHVVDAAGLPPDAAQGALLARAAALTAPVADARVASLASVLSRREEASGESALGDLITDAQLWATSTPGRGGAQIALTNPGGMRADLTPHDGIVTYGDVFAAQPFGNSLVVMQLSGAQLKEVLEQQWSGKSDKARILQVSRGFAYTWDAGRPAGDRVLAQTMSLNGEAIAPEKRYRVAVNSFMAEGGDGFTQFRDGGERMGGALDVDALVDYLRFLGDVPLPAGGRISRLN
jgi:5'-nucleotidase